MYYLYYVHFPFHFKNKDFLIICFVFSSTLLELIHTYDHIHSILHMHFSKQQFLADTLKIYQFWAMVFGCCLLDLCTYDVGCSIMKKRPLFHPICDIMVGKFYIKFDIQMSKQFSNDVYYVNAIGQLHH